MTNPSSLFFEDAAFQPNSSAHAWAPSPKKRSLEGVQGPQSQGCAAVEPIVKHVPQELLQ